MGTLKRNNSGARGFFGSAIIFLNRLGSGLSNGVPQSGVGGPVWGLGPLKIFSKSAPSLNGATWGANSLQFRQYKRSERGGHFLPDRNRTKRGPKKFLKKKHPFFGPKRYPPTLSISSEDPEPRASGYVFLERLDLEDGSRDIFISIGAPVPEIPIFKISKRCRNVENYEKDAIRMVQKECCVPLLFGFYVLPYSPILPYWLNLSRDRDQNPHRRRLCSNIVLQFDGHFEIFDFQLISCNLWMENYIYGSTGKFYSFKMYANTFVHR
ncbi:hypothetical protein WA026_014089 [Henosepilachna vigintioctopunctata]|uniref:Ribosomal protein L2 n=1 Tax=Henosepilachna vigintioctopunctata TaxID=420089 RepID=A0AAW1TMV2_9CUCU